MIESVFAWMLPCVTRTAFGREVVPDVNIRTASAPGSTGPALRPVGLPARPESLVGENLDARRRRRRRTYAAHADPRRTAAHPTRPALRRTSSGVSLSENGTATWLSFITAR